MSDFYSYKDLCVTSTGLPNIPDEATKKRLVKLCSNILYRIRDRIGQLPVVNSGYRSPQVNAKVKGSKTSQHCLGEAADITAPGYNSLELAQEIVDLALPYDQLIVYKDFVHVSYSCSHEQRNQILRGLQNGERYRGELPKLPQASPTVVTSSLSIPSSSNVK